MPPLSIDIRHESWPLSEPFAIARGTKTSAEIVIVTVSDGEASGQGEAVPYARYGETIDGVMADVSAAVAALRTGARPHDLLKPGAALNVLDCALIDFEAKKSGEPAYARLGLAPPVPVITAFTISLGTPEAMAAKAKSVAALALLKLKLGGAGDAERMRAVRAARPDARLIADANEAWTFAMVEPLLTIAAELGFETVEQPLPEHDDAALAHIQHPVALTADESVHTAADIARLAGRYDAVNIKLDKAGGLTGAVALRDAARAAGMDIMIGSMVATSLAIAPALLLANGARWVDLDGPLLLARDRPHGLTIRNGIMSPADTRLWG